MPVHSWVRLLRHVIFLLMEYKWASFFQKTKWKSIRQHLKVRFGARRQFVCRYVHLGSFSLLSESCIWKTDDVVGIRGRRKHTFTFPTVAGKLILRDWWCHELHSVFTCKHWKWVSGRLHVLIQVKCQHWIWINLCLQDVKLMYGEMNCSVCCCSSSLHFLCLSPGGGMW